ncbi:putative T7SS-secreted protein [Motilibacter aurantiacus]|uniref:putative T7SS-secreted protein n=1 Tax=Motilibacter aurantiacus TaxID=2714955 RepID=UPI00140B69EB|nr:hypothetical protein [Motilibacter aurantiacus]NHC44038.1 hypothetical protein [Motilibacter aurantiacus]
MPDFTVPGDVGALRAHARLLADAAGGMDESSAAVGKVSTGVWDGKAADAFEDVRRRAAGAWSDAAAAVRRASAAVAAYADALERAQQQASRALTSYNDAVRRTNEAVAAYNADVQAGTATGPFRDPGQADRDRATAELTGARQAVDEAGANAAATVRAAAILAPRGPVVPVPTSPYDDLATGSDGRTPGGPVAGLPTDSATLAQLLELARSMGMQPTQYAGLLRQYWTAVAAERAGIDLSAWDPAAGAGANRETIEAVYRYYGQLFLDHPELQWAGMANLIGPSFAGGFLDLDLFKDIARGVADGLDRVPGGGPLLPPALAGMSDLADLGGAELAYYERMLLGMQKEIFFDQGMMHEAYLGGGNAALDELLAAGVLDTGAREAWAAIDQGHRTGDDAMLAAGNQALLRREQMQIIPNEYDEMRDHFPSGEAFTYLLTAVGAPSIPGAQTPGQYSPLTFSGEIPVVTLPLVDADVEVTVETPLPDFNIADRNARWDMIINDTLPAYQQVLEDPDRAADLVGSDVTARIEAQRIANQYDDILRRLLDDWHINVDGDLDLGP